MRKRRTKDIAGLENASPCYVWMCRIISLLMLLLLAVIPWSERYSQLDNFPHGQDTELNLLAFFLILGIILLFARSWVKALRTFLAVFYVLISVLRPLSDAIQQSSRSAVLNIADSPPGPCTPLDSHNLPLLI